MALVDTSALIDLGKGVKKAAEVVLNAEGEGEKIRVSSVSVFELSSGSPAGIDEKRRKFLEPMSQIPFNSEHAEIAGMVFRNLRNKGEDIGAADAMIAGAALCENEPLITANVKHFSRVEGLRLVTY